MYANHGLRAICITTLDQNGFEARHIMAVSGQKSEANIRSYSRHVADSKMRATSLSLSSHITGFNPEEQTVTQRSLVLQQ